MMKLGSNVISQWQLERNPQYSGVNWKNWRRESVANLAKESSIGVQTVRDINKRNESWMLCMYYVYTGCPRRNVRDFGRVFLMLNYTDITQSTYVQSRTVTEINGQRKVWASWVSKYYTPSVTSYLSSAPARSKRHGHAVTLACALQHGSSDVTI